MECRNLLVYSNIVFLLLFSGNFDLDVDINDWSLDEESIMEKPIQCQDTVSLLKSEQKYKFLAFLDSCSVASVNCYRFK